METPLPMALRLLRSFGAALLVGVVAGSSHCRPQHAQKQLGDGGGRLNPQWIVYGLTQDCQLFFARPDQLEQLRHLTVQPKVTYCLPNLVQLHWRQMHTHAADGSQLALQLLFKRAKSQICTLPVDFPSKNALSGFTVFSYSILSSLSYAACSYIANSTFELEPDLSFMDTSYSNVVYFADPNSKGSFWKVRQFKVDRNGYLKTLETFTVQNTNDDEKVISLYARDHVLALDAERHKLHFVGRQSKAVRYVCAYDLLFRPSQARIKTTLPLRHDNAHYRVNSLAADGTRMFIGESHRQSNDRFSTRLWLSDRSKNGSAECLLDLPFLAEFGLISLEAKDALEKIHLPRFGHHHHRPHKATPTRQGSTGQNTKQLPSRTAKPVQLTTRILPSSSSSTSKPTQAKAAETTTAKAGKEAASDVGDGRILQSDELADLDEMSASEDPEGDVGFITEITSHKQQPTVEGSGESESLATAFDAKQANLTSAAQGTLSQALLPVTLVAIWFSIV